MAEEQVRLEVAFEGGQTIGALVASELVDELREALARGPEGVFELPTDDGTYVRPAPRRHVREALPPRVADRLRPGGLAASSRLAGCPL